MIFPTPFTATETSLDEDMKLRVTQFRSPFHYFFPITVKLSPHTIVKCPQYIFFP